jgi:hypothetical protein
MLLRPCTLQDDGPDAVVRSLDHQVADIHGEFGKLRSRPISDLRLSPVEGPRDPRCTIAGVEANSAPKRRAFCRSLRISANPLQGCFALTGRGGLN